MYVCQQTFRKLYEQIREKFNLFFKSFLLALTKFSIWQRDWALGYNSMKFRHSPCISWFPKVLSEATRIYLVRQLVYTMFISNNRASFHLSWKESLLKPQKVSKYYAIDCSVAFYIETIHLFCRAKWMTGFS